MTAIETTLTTKLHNLNLDESPEFPFVILDHLISNRTKVSVSRRNCSTSLEFWTNVASPEYTSCYCEVTVEISPICDAIALQIRSTDSTGYAKEMEDALRQLEATITKLLGERP
jgi:hypothetical protein